MRNAVCALALLGLLLGCGSPKTPAELTLSPNPAIIDGLGQASTIGVTASDEDGMPGKGTVQLSSTAGSLKTAAPVTLDVNGYGETVFHCVTADDPMCTGSVQVKGTWSRAGKETINAYGDLTVGASGAGGGSGGGSGGGTNGGGSGGGAGGGSGSHTPCQPGQVPGLSVICCQGGGAVGPPCNWAKMADGQSTMTLPFTGPNGPVMLPIVFTVGSHYADANACGSFQSGWRVDASSVGENTLFTLQAIVDEGVIKADGSWVVTNSMEVHSYDINQGGECADEFPMSGAAAIGDFHVTQPSPPPNGFKLANGDVYSLGTVSSGNGYYYVNVK